MVPKRSHADFQATDRAERSLRDSNMNSEEQDEKVVRSVKKPQLDLSKLTPNFKAQKAASFYNPDDLSNRNRMVQIKTQGSSDGHDTIN